MTITGEKGICFDLSGKLLAFSPESLSFATFHETGFIATLWYDICDSAMAASKNDMVSFSEFVVQE